MSEEVPTPSRAVGWLAWMGGLAVIGLSMQVGLAAVPSLGAAWALLFASSLVAIGITAWFWPNRQALWRGYRLSLSAAMVTLLVVAAGAAVFGHGLFGLNHLTM